jgi:hypothetical protein
MKKLVPVLLLAVLFLASCYPGGPITISTPGQLPVINSFSAEPSSISAGQSSTLNWTVTGATTVSIDQGIGNVALTGPRAVAPSVTTVYTLTASSSAGSVTATTQIIVTGAAPTPTGLPVINYFTANPSSISLGSSVTFSWNVSNATSVTIDNGVGAVGSSGSTIVLPSTTTVFTLTATNAAGSDTATALVIVSGVPSPPAGLPVIDYFTATPPIIAGGGSTTLSWNVSYATSVTIDDGIGPVGSAGTTIVSPASSTNYTLTATNAAGWRTQTIAVLVTGAPPAVPLTVTLTPVAGETGSVYSAAHSPVTSILAGDAGDNTGIRAYFSFDISSLAGKNVTNATLTFTTQNVVRNPWANLTGLWIGTVNYGIGPLQNADYIIASNPLVGSWLTSAPGTINVTSTVHAAAAASSPRFQVRAHFASTTNNDNLADYIMWSNATLTVTYLP